MKSLLIEKTILHIFVFLFFASTCLAKDGTIVVNINNDRKNSINIPIRACLSKGSNCLYKKERSIQEVTGYLNSKGQVTIKFKDVPFGVYAVYAYEDRDKDKKFRPYRSGSWLPSERYGISNNPPLKAGGIYYDALPPNKRSKIHLIKLKERNHNIDIQLKKGAP